MRRFLVIIDYYEVIIFFCLVDMRVGRFFCANKDTNVWNKKEGVIFVKTECIREVLEKREHKMLSEYASFSDQSKGREKYMEPCTIRSCYQRDRDRILHCKSFRRLKHKTQVFLAPEGDHYRTRLTHTLEVSQIARTIAKGLWLNEELTEAIALGHDLGHTPFGHAGEKVLNKICEYGFQHAEQSVRVVELLERNGNGLNLTWEVRDGIHNHQTAKHPSTLEGQVVRLADKMAYVNHDIDDAIRGEIICKDDIPKEYCDILGYSKSERLNTLILSTIKSSFAKNEISMEPEVSEALVGMRKFLFEAVYTNPVAKGQEQKAQRMIEHLYFYYLEHLDKLPQEYRALMERGEPTPKVVCDYVAGMTDNYAIRMYTDCFIPKVWK